MPSWLQLSVEVITLALMLFGLLGLVIPIFPGSLIIWLASLGYGIVAKFDTLGWVMFALITLLMLVSVFIDDILVGAKARKSGASWLSVGVALVLGVAGNFVVPVLGGFIASLLALFIVEWIRRRNRKEAWKASLGLMAGYGLAFVIRFIMGIVMIGLWMIWAWS